MGYIKHHAIVVTSFDTSKISAAHLKASEIFGGLVSGLIESVINKYISFFIAPDGSKEGWHDSEVGDIKRDHFIKWIDEQAYEDGSNAISYAELFYGEDNRKSAIVRHN